MGDAELLANLMAARTTANVERIISRLPIVDPGDYFFGPDCNPTAEWKPGCLHWVPVGGDRGNSGRIKLAGEPTGPIVERTVNGMESIIELARLLEKRDRPTTPMPASPRDAVLRYFGLPPLDVIPRLDDQEEQKEMQRRINKMRGRLSVRLDFEDREFTFLVRDEGMGQVASRMHSTLLSLGHTDKADKPYLIGVFGQGGSSAFSVSRYSIVMTRRAADLLGSEPDRVGWSIVREIEPPGTRDSYYAYLAQSEDRTVPWIDGKVADGVGFRSGSHFCHIKYDLGRSGQSVARRLYPMLNHHLFNPILPYDLYALKKKPDLMQGTAQRLSRRVAQSHSSQSLDRSFGPQAVI
jgi:hypothetical protein